MVLIKSEETQEKVLFCYNIYGWGFVFQQIEVTPETVDVLVYDLVP